MFALIIIRVGFNEKSSQFSRSVHPPNPIDPPFSATQAQTRVPQTALRPVAISVSVSRTDDHMSFDGYDRKMMDRHEDVDLEGGEVMH